ncbi:MAG: hypothetical protein LBE79_07700 [Tannerella sp.]|jgi:hypothetical protein|nr:hypothetical protein [Tannerella sp.]
MKPKQNILDELKGKNPFKTPSGYIEDLTIQIMSRIPDLTYKETKVISLRDRIRPWMYVAAVFAGLLICFRVFLFPAQQTGQAVDSNLLLQTLVSDELMFPISDDDLDFLDYLENQYVNIELAEEIDNME